MYMPSFDPCRCGRRGKVLVLFAVLLPVLLGLVALAVDTGVLGAARGQMQTSGDAAALAGAMRLAENRSPSSTTTLVSTARSSALSFANANLVLTRTLSFTNNATNDPAGQVVIGYLDPSNTTSTTLVTSGSVSQYNAVKVTALRDAQHQGAIPTSFAAVLGMSGSNMAVSSIAVMQNYTVKGFKSVNGQNANLLPIVLDVDTYKAMIGGTTTDQYTWNEQTKTVTAGPDLITESKLYPVASGDPGNWGTIKVGVSNNGTSTLGDQIRYGITPQQLATFPNSTIQVDTSLNPPSITFGGNPGISAGIKDDLASIIGKPVFIPIYDQTGGNGNNAWYRVIKFVGVRILSVNFQGNPKFVIIQPALVKDPDAIPGTPEPTLQNGGLVRVFLAR